MLVLGGLKNQGWLIGLMGKAGTLGGALSLIIGGLFLIGWFGAGMVVDYIDNELEENCDSTSGQIGQITGWDEGQCQDGRESRDFVSSLQTPLLLIGVALSGTGVFVLVRS
tara:strand:- start:231 stop:563 length:333 start_codon:yes stop_codon:yes gene_type:complete